MYRHAYDIMYVDFIVCIVISYGGVSINYIPALANLISVYIG